MSKQSRILLALSAVVMGILFVSLALVPERKHKGWVTDGANLRERTIAAGDEAFLRTPTGYVVSVAASKEDGDRYAKLLTANDQVGIGQLMVAGKIWLVPNGTQCRVIDRGIFRSEVRILNGEHAGSAGFVASGELSAQ